MQSLVATSFISLILISNINIDHSFHSSSSSVLWPSPYTIRLWWPRDFSGRLWLPILSYHRVFLFCIVLFVHLVVTLLAVKAKSFFVHLLFLSFMSLLKKQNADHMLTVVTLRSSCTPFIMSTFGEVGSPAAQCCRRSCRLSTGRQHRNNLMKALIRTWGQV